VQHRHKRKALEHQPARKLGGAQNKRIAANIKCTAVELFTMRARAAYRRSCATPGSHDNNVSLGIGPQPRLVVGKLFRVQVDGLGHVAVQEPGRAVQLRGSGSSAGHLHQHWCHFLAYSSSSRTSSTVAQGRSCKKSGMEIRGVNSFFFSSRDNCTNGLWRGMRHTK